VDVHVERELRVGVAGVAPRGEVAHVGHSGEADEARPLVQQRVEVGDREIGAAGELQQHRGVEVSGARAHDEPLERGETHRGLDRSAALDRRDGRAVAEVEHDLPQIGEGATEEGGRRFAHELVARAVEAVPADAVRLGQFAVDRVRVGGGGERLVERGVEHRDVRHARKRLLRRDDAGEVRRVVERRQDRQLVDVDLDERGHERRFEEARPAVDHAVSDGDRRSLLERRPVDRERLEHDGEPRRVVGDLTFDGGRGIHDRRRGAALGAQGRRGDRVRGDADPLADALDQSRGEHALVLHVEQLVLERRRTAVDDQYDAHARLPWAWIAVIAIVLTMSSTSAPRDRSLMGLFRPCRTGPIATAPAERCTAL